MSYYRQKYGNHKITIDGIKFDSEKEYRRWCELKEEEDAGKITDLKIHVPYILIPTQTDKETGKVIERKVKYYADFVYIKNGKIIVEDTKSPITKTTEYIIKRKLMLFVHGIRIKEL